MRAPVYEIVLAPKEGDGFLQADDVVAKVCMLPPGSRVLVRFEFCEDYEPAAPGILARHLTGCLVEHHFGNAAWRAPSGGWRRTTARRRRTSRSRPTTSAAAPDPRGFVTPRS